MKKAVLFADIGLTAYATYLGFSESPWWFMLSAIGVVIVAGGILELKEEKHGR